MTQTVVRLCAPTNQMLASLCAWTCALTRCATSLAPAANRQSCSREDDGRALTRKRLTGCSLSDRPLCDCPILIVLNSERVLPTVPPNDSAILARRVPTSDLVSASVLALASAILDRFSAHTTMRLIKRTPTTLATTAIMIVVVSNAIMFVVVSSLTVEGQVVSGVMLLVHLASSHEPVEVLMPTLLPVLHQTQPMTPLAPMQLSHARPAQTSAQSAVFSTFLWPVGASVTAERRHLPPAENTLLLNRPYSKASFRSRSENEIGRVGGQVFKGKHSSKFPRVGGQVH